MYYDEKANIVTISNTINKIYGLETYHPIYEPLYDALIKAGVPKRKLALLLLDGYGTIIQERYASKEDYILKNKKFTITSIYPPTTAAATTALLSSKYPCETGWLGWFIRMPNVDQPVIMFSAVTKDQTKVISPNLYEYLPYDSLIDRINQRTDYKAKDLHSFKLEDPSIESYFKACEDVIKSSDFSYLYCTQPDHVLHEKGTSKDAQEVIDELNIRMKELVSKFKDTVFMVIADHGHIDITYRYLKDYPDVMDLLDFKYNALEPRACMLHSKKGKEKELGLLLKKYFSDVFDIYSKEEIKSKKIFGLGQECEKFDSILGDYLLVANSTIALVEEKEEEELVSHHAGRTKDEMLVNVSLFNL